MNCALCEGDGQIVQGISIYARDHMYPEIVTCPDCGGTGKRGPMEPRLITALRAGRREHTPEAEGVLLSARGDTVTLTLDDGETLSFDRREFASWLEAM